MDLHSIETGLFKLDGGAMFGVVPKSIWSKSVTADDSNLCVFAMRCLLIISGKRTILIDTGCGDKQDYHFFKHYQLHGANRLVPSIRSKGLDVTDITDVVLTHLHFDHVGGATCWNASKTHIVPTFPNATYWVTEAHWHWAEKPNPREGASFLSNNLVPLQASGQLKFINESFLEGFPEMRFTTVNGHTEQMIIPSIYYKDQIVSYMADLIPTTAHVPLPYLASYDIRPLEAMNEKHLFLERAIKENHLLFFEHDAQHEACTLKRTDKGIRPDLFTTLTRWV